MNLKENTFFSEKKEKIYLRKEYFEQPYEVVFRSLIESIKIVGKKKCWTETKIWVNKYKH